MMFMFKTFSRTTLYLLILMLLLSACGELPRRNGTDFSSATGSADSGSSDEVRYQVVMMAAAMLGTPYKWGGMHPDEGFDCSGLVHYSYQQAGVELPRTSLQQYKYSRSVRLSNLKPGDLLFFELNDQAVSHVGIYLGNNRFVHAPKTGKDVMITRLDNQFWRQRLVSAGRVI